MKDAKVETVTRGEEVQIQASKLTKAEKIVELIDSLKLEKKQGNHHYQLPRSKLKKASEKLQKLRNWPWLASNECKKKIVSEYKHRDQYIEDSFDAYAEGFEAY